MKMKNKIDGEKTMNKKISAVIISIFLVVVLVYAQAIDNKNLETSKEYKTALESINLGDYSYWDNQQGDLFQRCLYKEICTDSIVEIEDENMTLKNVTITTCRNVINTCSGFMDEDLLNDWETKRMEGIANATIERQNRDEVIKVTEGVVTITEE